MPAWSVVSATISIFLVLRVCRQAQARQLRSRLAGAGVHCVHANGANAFLAFRARIDNAEVPGRLCSRLPPATNRKAPVDLAACAAYAADAAVSSRFCSSATSGRAGWLFGQFNQRTQYRNSLASKGPLKFPANHAQ